MVGASDAAPPDTGGGGGRQWLMRCGGQRRRRRSGAGTVEERARRCGRTGRTRVVFSEDRAVDAPSITRDYRASSDVLLSNFIVIEMEGTVFTPSLEGIKHVKSDSGEILTKPFLEVCKHILPVLEKFGSAMSIVKSDIGGNITRLEAKYASDPSKFEQLHSMVKIEVSTKTTKSSSSCTNGLLWLTRAMDFLVALFHNLVKHPDWQMSQACSDAYGKTLKKWHGWLASSSFSVAIKLAPDRKKFMEIISGSGDINADIEKFCATFSPLLAENHKFLASVGMDDLKAS